MKYLTKRQEMLKEKMRRRHWRAPRVAARRGRPPLAGGTKSQSHCAFVKIGKACRCVVCVRMDDRSRTWCRWARLKVARIQAELDAERMISICR